MHEEQNRLMLALDSHTLITVLTNSHVAKKILEFFRGNSTEIALQDIVIKEIVKVSTSKENRRIDDFV
jgi:predicted nucleic acid-binding protein